MAYYNLVFQGKIIDGASLDEVKNNVARLFKADAAKIATLFSGKTIVIKKNLDTQATKKYLAIMQQAGAVIKAVKIEQPKKDKQSNTPEQTQSSSLSSGLASLVSHGKPKPPLAEDDISSDDDNALQLAPAGSNILNHAAQNETAEIPDTSHISMSAAETGSLEEFAQRTEAVELPNIDNLTMSEANIGSLEEFTITTEPMELPDISDLDLAEQDSTALSGATPRAEPVETPDTSGLSLSEAQEGTLEGLENKVKPVKIPDTSHIEIEQLDETTAVNNNTSGTASYQID